MLYAQMHLLNTFLILPKFCLKILVLRLLGDDCRNMGSRVAVVTVKGCKIFPCLFTIESVIVSLAKLNDLLCKFLKMKLSKYGAKGSKH